MGKMHLNYSTCLKRLLNHMILVNSLNWIILTAKSTWPSIYNYMLKAIKMILIEWLLYFKTDKLTEMLLINKYKIIQVIHNIKEQIKYKNNK